MNATSVDVLMMDESIVFATRYPGGSDGGSYGYNLNKIVKVKSDGTYYTNLVIGGIGPNGIKGMAVDWINGELRNRIIIHSYCGLILFLLIISLKNRNLT